MLALSRTDERVQAGKPISPGFLFATLLWHEVVVQWNARIMRGEHKVPALDAAIDDVLDSQTEKLAIQRRYTSDMREIWMLQPRYERRTGRAPIKLLEHMRLRAGYDFLLLRCAAEEAPAELGDWWTQFMHAGAEDRERLLAQAQLGGSAQRSSRRRRGRRGKGAATAGNEPADTRN
jgi:poly(A) polymerase